MKLLLVMVMGGGGMVLTCNVGKEATSGLDRFESERGCALWRMKEN